MLRTPLLRNKACTTVLVLCLLCTSQVLSGVVQSIGWLYMFASYVEDCSPTEALQRTFAGAEPCCFCEASATIYQDAGAGDNNLAPRPPSLDGMYTAAEVFAWLPVDRGPGERLPGSPLLYDFSRTDHQAPPG